MGLVLFSFDMCLAKTLKVWVADDGKDLTVVGRRFFRRHSLDNNKRKIKNLTMYARYMHTS